mmetsp:Transcript_32488/g.31741  ORF Transcript_32488/g.31741 Transcript_32488/m.31741 type:complete len:105 (-) Transcript_32488:113-427(-)
MFLSCLFKFGLNLNFTRDGEGANNLRLLLLPYDLVEVFSVFLVIQIVLHYAHIQLRSAPIARPHPFKVIFFFQDAIVKQQVLSSFRFRHQSLRGQLVLKLDPVS